MTRLQSVNYIEQRGPSDVVWIHRAWWLHKLPQPLVLCRVFGHRPVVDGTAGFRDAAGGHRWVVCDRCGVRPEPQGNLDPYVWRIGERYTGPWDGERSMLTGFQFPLAWPGEPTGTVGAEVVLGLRRMPRLGFTLKVGNSGSEHTLAADFHLPWIGSLYLHTERFGQWMVRRFNPVGYHSRVIGLDVSGGHLTWKVWAKRDDWSRDDPWWMYGSVQIDPRTILLGPKRYTYDNVGDPTVATVRLPHGDHYEVRLQLQRRTHGRRRGRKRASWSVDWAADSGIPAKPGNRDRHFGGHTAVTSVTVRAGTWPVEAAALIAARLVELRHGNDWEPAEVAM